MFSFAEICANTWQGLKWLNCPDCDANDHGQGVYNSSASRIYIVDVHCPCKILHTWSTASSQVKWIFLLHKLKDIKSSVKIFHRSAGSDLRNWTSPSSHHLSFLLKIPQIGQKRDTEKNWEKIWNGFVHNWNMLNSKLKLKRQSSVFSASSM